MKSFTNHRSILTTIAVALAGVAFLVNTAAAQEKGAQQLLKPTAGNSAQALTAADTTGMACPKCKDTLVMGAQPAGKGMRQASQSSRHECPTCSTKIVTTGVGKQAQNKALHTCQETSGADASCCAMHPAAGAAATAANHKH